MGWRGEYLRGDADEVVGCGWRGVGLECKLEEAVERGVEKREARARGLIQWTPGLGGNVRAIGDSDGDRVDTHRSGNVKGKRGKKRDSGRNTPGGQGESDWEEERGDLQVAWKFLRESGEMMKMVVALAKASMEGRGMESGLVAVELMNEDSIYEMA